MLRRRFLTLFLASTLFGFTREIQAQDWPQFRGPHRDGVSPDKGLLKEWPKDGPEVVWKCSDLGVGFSSVAIQGDRIYTMGDLKDGCYVFGIDRAKGTLLWKKLIGKAGGNYVGPRCTPTADGDSVYALGQFGDFVCLDSKTGEERWKKNIGKDFKGRSGGWNFAESPLIDGDKLVVTPGGADFTMVALNKKTGDLIWKGLVPGGDTAGYSSIVVADIDGVKQYIQLMANGLVSFSADKGELLWRYGTGNDRFGHNTANIPTAIVQGNQIFASAGYGRGAALLTVSSSGGKFDVHEEYWVNALTNKHGGVIHVGDSVYGDRDDSGRPWSADFKTGKVKWSKSDRSKGNGSASPTFADGLLYIRYANGWVSLVNPEDGKEISTFKIPNGSSNCWAHPVVIGGKMYIRENDTLWCYDVKGK
ncbi:PQQ-binding-like beta-propeller repeat protein [Telmatocola sphagniphila]|uniref:PQQ-binding-like beta-propeller repeat protein n=1 Tax=Telmatocola sphagniphila TaxID=1123043 RepID=A0A8E6B2S2_9BACT|nr:PQQ-binding-like beta-propeller repeat protein [Telmatocola sphagniphila]QVL30359.1 PQQ-binding-like beta-propeller repeat protein [Telmatocola sphagniphila]